MMQPQQPITLPPPPVPIGFTQPEWIAGFNPPKQSQATQWPWVDKKWYAVWVKRLSTK